MTDSAEEKKTKKSKSTLEAYVGIFDESTVSKDPELFELMEIEKNNNFLTENYKEFIEKSLNLQSQMDQEFKNELYQNATRLENFERQIRENYSPGFEKIFGAFDIVPEYIPIYRIIPGADDLFFEEHIHAKGFYRHNTAVFKSTVVDDFLLVGAVHETVHHNMKLFREMHKLGRRDRYVDEGLTEFITISIMGNDYENAFDKIRKKHPGFLENERKKPKAPYEFGKQYFQLIYDALGMDGVFEAYKSASTLQELNDFIFEKNLDIYKNEKN